MKRNGILFGVVGLLLYNAAVTAGADTPADLRDAAATALQKLKSGELAALVRAKPCRQNTGKRLLCAVP